MSQAEVRFNRGCKELERIADRLDNNQHDERSIDNIRERVLQLTNYLYEYYVNHSLTEEQTSQLFDAGVTVSRIKHILEHDYETCLSCGDELIENWNSYGYDCLNCD